MVLLPLHGGSYLQISSRNLFWDILKSSDRTFNSVICLNIMRQFSFLFFFLINLFIYLSIFGCVGSSSLCAGFLQLPRAEATLDCGAWASHCGDFCCGARALGARASVVVAHGLQSTGSVVVAHGLSYSVACGIFLDQGSNPCPLHWQADSQPLRHQGSPETVFLRSLSRFFFQLSICKPPVSK